TCLLARSVQKCPAINRKKQRSYRIGRYPVSKDKEATCKYSMSPPRSNCLKAEYHRLNEERREQCKKIRELQMIRDLCNR
ncbi:unnamed protein product, partial [Heterotrigona itama]